MRVEVVMAAALIIRYHLTEFQATQPNRKDRIHQWEVLRIMPVLAPITTISQVPVIFHPTTQLPPRSLLSKH